MKVTQSEDTFTATFEDLLFENHYRYLDIAFLNHLWDQEWKGLSDIFPTPEETSNTRQKEISTADIAKLLTFYRCLDPGSYLSAVEWFETTTCNILLNMEPGQINESRFYRELTAIENQKEKIEQWLYQTLKNRNEESMRIVFYDLTDSCFEGRKCPIAKPGRTKANGFREKRIVLSLLENKQSYLYITALDKPQIEGIEKVNLERFKGFTNETTEKEILSKGLTKYDNLTFYEDMGVDSTNRRHILIFNSDLFKVQRKTRKKLIDIAIMELGEEKKSLMEAKKSNAGRWYLDAGNKHYRDHGI